MTTDTSREADLSPVRGRMKQPRRVRQHSIRGLTNSLDMSKEVAGLKSTQSLCTVEGCDRPYYGRDLCAGHYDRWRRNGDGFDRSPITRHAKSSQAMVERFHERYDVDSNGCWIWNRSLNRFGYGQWSDHRKNIKAHRWSYMTFVGPIPDGMIVGHKCDVKRCVNPDHLEAITPQQNTQDAYDRGLAHAWQTRETHCPNGHEYTDYRRGRQRRCLTCERARNAERKVRAILADTDEGSEQ